MAWSGPNWRLFSKLSALGFVGVLCYTLSPWAMCVGRGMDSARIEQVGAADGHGLGNTGDEMRAENAERFLAGFLGPVGWCYSAHPIGDDGQDWQWAALGGLLFGIFAFRRLDRWQYSRRIRRMSKDYAAVDHVSASARHHTPLELDAVDPSEPDWPSASPPKKSSAPHVAAPRKQSTGTLRASPRPGSTELGVAPQADDAPDWEWD